MRRPPRRPDRLHHRDGTSGEIRWPRRAVTGGQKVHGWACFASGQTAVATVDPLPDQADTLLHEMLHHGDPKIPERYVRRAATALAEMIPRNPDAIRWILWALTKG